jgi:hypothetical protein
MRHLKKHGVSLNVSGTNDNAAKGTNHLKCDSCEYVARRPEHLNRHIETIHSEERKYLCQVCGIGFKRIDALKQHHVTHKLEDEEALEENHTPAFKCNLCNKICRSKSALKEHLMVHDNKKTFHCDICSKSFNTANILQKHKKSIHSSPGSFPCLICDKKFNTPFNLKRHTRTHKSGVISTTLSEDDNAVINQTPNLPVNHNSIILITDGNSNNQNLTRLIPIDLI